MDDTDLETAIKVIEFYEAVMREQTARIATLEAEKAELELVIPNDTKSGPPKTIRNDTELGAELSSR